ncbi:MAG TPA: hypothetical protein VFM58_01065, partial [Solirubrobacteraceae bacterium]|nr:hypothetical protein [Solirubrobacteraceae bacterium]
ARRAELSARADRFDAELRAGGAARLRLRRRLAALKGALLRRRDYHREPPREIVEAFGDLRAV